MNAVESFLTLANLYDPQKAQQNSLSALKNRVDTMALQGQVGNDALILQAGKNLMNAAQAAQPDNGQASVTPAAPVQNAAGNPFQAPAMNAASPAMGAAMNPPAFQGAQPNAAAPTAGPVATPAPAQPGPQKAAPGNAGPDPAATQADPDILDIPGIGKVSRKYLESNPLAMEAAQRAMVTYGQQQQAQAQQIFGQMMTATQGQIQQSFNGNDQIKKDETVKLIESNPKMLETYKASGLWMTIKNTEFGQGGAPHTAPMYVSQDQMDKLVKAPGSKVSPDTPPGFYEVQYKSPPGVSVFDPKSTAVNLKPMNMNKEKLEEWADGGNKDAIRMLDSRSSRELELAKKKAALGKTEKERTAINSYMATHNGETPDGEQLRDEMLKNAKLFDDQKNTTNNLYLRAQKGDLEAKAALKKIYADKLGLAVAGGTARAEAFGNIREYPVINKSTGELEFVNAKTMNANPGMYGPPGATEKAMSKTAVIAEIRNSKDNLRGSIKNLKNDFDSGTRAKIVLFMKSRDPAGAISNFVGSSVGKTLKPDQIQYLTDLNQMIESAAAMRTVLGTGQGSDLSRKLMENTVPSLITPNKEYANTQLDKLESQLAVLEQGVPNVPMVKKPGGAPAHAPNPAAKSAPATADDLRKRYGL